MGTYPGHYGTYVGDYDSLSHLSWRLYPLEETEVDDDPGKEETEPDLPVETGSHVNVSSRLEGRCVPVVSIVNERERERGGGDIGVLYTQIDVGIWFRNECKNVHAMLYRTYWSGVQSLHYIYIQFLCKHKCKVCQSCCSTFTTCSVTIPVQGS